MMHLYVYFREQKGGPVNPASSKYSSPSKVNAPAEPVGQEKAGGECKLMSGRGLIRATPVGLLLPFAFTSLDKAVSLSLQFSIPSRYKLFSCLDFFWLCPSSLRQCFPFFFLQPQSCSACCSELTKVDLFVLSQLPKLLLNWA